MARGRNGHPELTPSGFFVLRTPLLPFDLITTWGSGLEAPANTGDGVALAAKLDRDRRRLRERLAALAADPEFRDAVFVASPALEAAVDIWRSAPESDRGRKTEQPLVSYFSRACARPTPFGLFAGCSTGVVASSTALSLEGREHYRRHSRLDMEYLCALAEAIPRDPVLRRELLYGPNSSLYEAGERLHFVEASQSPGRRTYKLVAVDSTPYLAATLARAEGGASISELAAALVDDEVTQTEAEAWVGELIDSQLLVPDVEPNLTGELPLEPLVRKLSARPATAAFAGRLAEAGRQLAAIDSGGIGASRDRYEEVARALADLPVEPQLARLVQVDLTKPTAGLTIGANVVSEIAAGAAMLHALAPTPRGDALVRFRERFTSRYETREVPLVEVLDEEHGIGFELLGEDQDRGTAAPAAGARARMLLRKFAEAVARGAQEIPLDAKELAGLGLPEPRPLPEGVEVVAAVEADSPAAADSGDFRVYIQSVSGPPGARLSARFCHADPRLHGFIRAQLHAEEGPRDDAVFAEIVHLPEDRVGNILSRPLLREYEIPYLGVSAAPPDRQLPVTDILLSIQGERIVLRSRRLDREILPRLTTAHNFSFSTLPIYRFLAALQHQDVAPAVMWDWGALSHAPFLPRVVSGRVVLSRARWNLDATEVAVFAAAGDGEGYLALQQLRLRRRLPRFVALADGDNELVIDLDNILMLDAFAREVKGRAAVALVEVFPDPERLCVRGPEGRFVHQLVVPFQNPVPATPPVPVTRTAAHVLRRFAPASEWLYLKLFTGSATADLVLDRVGYTIDEAVSSGAVDRWFFIRYGDPDWHLRLRLHGDPLRLVAETLPRLHSVMEPLLADGRLWRVQLDTYEREVERYGGPRGIEVAERLFHADSVAVLQLVRELGGDEPGRWRAALAGIYLLFDDFQLTLDEKRQIVERACRGYGRELGVNKQFQAEMSRRYRRERAAIEALFGHGEHRTPPVIEPLHARAAANAPLVRELRALAEVGKLSQPVPEIVMSCAHMHVNRLLRSAQRAHELVLYEMLARLYSSEAARARAAST